MKVTFLFLILFIVIGGLGYLFWDQITGRVEDVESTNQGIVTSAVRDQAIISCVKACRRYKSIFIEEFKQGPCLEEIAQDDWACDAVHDPRQEVDNDPTNQCGSFASGETNHFVEVDMNCDVVRAL